ncbi:hypothetical protein BDN67DRAFT_988161 [Paxillus ammoniavirescens]|nr:hypothetical protein BDN67DRAFT_988161 [Paxillus ammoniavirescens]
MATHAAHGLPLLSGPPPPPAPPEASACRKCGKEFNILFNRQRKCMHCGYAYCSSCSDYQALIPRRGPSHGYDRVAVCGFCIEFLNVTALGRNQLKMLPLAKLRRYIDAYDIQVKDPIDKSDFIDAISAVRTPQGCLPVMNEGYYRRHSVPSYNLASSPTASGSSQPSAATRARNLTQTHSSFPRPDLDPSRQRSPQETPYRTYTPPRARTTSAPLNPGASQPTGRQPNIPRPASSYGSRFPPSAPNTTNTPSSSTPAQPAPSPAPPPLSTLVSLPSSSVSILSVGTLKKILWDARVRLPPGVVEKDELVERVLVLVEEERRKHDEDSDAGVGDEEEYEMEGVEGHAYEEVVVEMAEPESETHPELRHEQGQQHGYHDSGAREGVHDSEVGGASDAEEDVEMNEVEREEHLTTPGVDAGRRRPTTPQPFASSQSPTSSPHSQPPASPSSPTPKPKPHSRPAKPADSMRSGLCVICQDEEANIAIVDCGHLAMCRACSDLVLASSRECPLCRTRIVTEARLLRIFKT